MKYSIIIPVFNAQAYISNCIDSILIQRNHSYEIEILIIDDCSSDNTLGKVKRLHQKHKEIRFFKTNMNSGPGVARNIGISHSTGDWIMFVDCDDQLNNNALKTINNYIKKSEIEYDIIAYNFEYDLNSNVTSHNSSRNDFPSLSKNKNELILDYLSLYMDGSVIYTLMSRKLIENNNIKFFNGFHEDIDFLFKVYLNCNNIGLINESLYIKHNHNDSIINNISVKHLTGIYRAYKEMYTYMEENNINSEDRIIAYYIGIIGVCATRIRIICNQEAEISKTLYISLYNEVTSAFKKIPQSTKLPKLVTKYSMIYDFLKENMNNSSLVRDVKSYVDNISKKSWSCYDLHHSLFLAPNEIRTCCKRFFIDNQIKGDVCLLSNKNNDYKDFSVQNILKAKRNLYIKINKGTSDECSGCPFLAFKEWPDFNALDIQYLSFEYHSVCNMKCVYCSDTYYGGKKNSYEIVSLIDDLVNTNSLDNCETVVWGGGEPTLDKDFSLLLKKIEVNFPTIKQRVITNSTTYVETIKKLIDEDKVSIITSIDAGSEEVFYQVRKHRNFHTVLNNLVKYAEHKAENITIKYIILDENNDIPNITGFVKFIEEKNLRNCNFHISFDFKKELVDFESLLSIALLYGLLIKLDVRLVFVDDLLRSRLSYTFETYNKLRDELKKLNSDDILADYTKLTDIVIWGAGNQTKNIIENSLFLKNTNIKYLVDNTKSKIGNKFLGYDIYDPSVLLENDYPILISATQATPQILKTFKLMKLEEDRIIKSFIL